MITIKLIQRWPPKFKFSFTHSSSFQIPFLDRLAFKLTRTSILLVLFLGLLVAIGQVYLDFKAQRQSIEANIEEVFRVNRNAVQRAVHMLDDRLANEVVKGLQNYEFLNHIVIHDDSQVPMAEYTEAIESSSTLWLTRLLMKESKDYVHDLVYSDGTYEGRFVLTVNHDVAMAAFYDRAMYVFISGLLRNLSLAFIMVMLYHATLTRPLMSIANSFSKIDTNKPEGQRIEVFKRHEEDELGFIINSANTLLSSLEKRQLELKQVSEQLRIIVDSSPNQIYAVNRSGEFVFLNSATATFYKKSIEELIGKSHYGIHKDINDEEAEAILVNVNQADSTNNSIMDVEQRVTDAAGNKFVMQTSYIPFQVFDQACILVITTDITARVEAEEHVERLAYFDSLTGLPNRNLLYDRLTMDITRAKRDNSHGALLFIDLDDFKRINDTMGHSVGDELLLKLARKMQAQIRQTDTLARLGGDEFTLSLPELSHDKHSALQQAEELSQRLITTIRAPIILGNQEFNVSASIGVAMFPSGSGSTEELLRFADTAMYQAKREGRNCYQIFQQSMATEADRLVQLESDIRKALKENHFTFYLQPIVDARTEKIVSAEALLRWMHPLRGTILPGDFIGFLENSSMIYAVGQMMLNDTCQYIKTIEKRYKMPDDFRISVNISTKEFYQLDFVEQVTEVLKHYGIPGSRLEFEITESAALQRINDAVKTMNQLRQLGITFSLDDFGTGYSSLNYLKRLPVDKIKIDKSFTSDLTTDPQGEALVSSIITIAQNLELQVVAEGVETQEQAAWFNKYDGVLFQGFLFDKPMPSDQFSSEYLKFRHLKSV